MSDIRVIVVITDASPELAEELERTSPRARAERMRSLATMGLKWVQNTAPVSRKIKQPKSDDAQEMQQHSMTASPNTVKPGENYIGEKEVFSAPATAPSLFNAPEDRPKEIQETGEDSALQRRRSKAAMFAKTLGGNGQG